jgi:hypothetical protein
MTMKSKMFSIVSATAIAILMMSAAANAEGPSGVNEGGNTQISVTYLPCSIVEKELPLVQDPSKTGLYHLTVATNTTGSWLQQGRKVYYLINGAYQYSTALEVMVPPGNQFTLMKVPGGIGLPPGTRGPTCKAWIAPW